MKNHKSQARSQRRLYEKYLKKNNPAEFKKWKSEAKLRGDKIHAENLESMRKTNESIREIRQSEVVQKMLEEGKPQTEIDEYLKDNS